LLESVDTYGSCQALARCNNVSAIVVSGCGIDMACAVTHGKKGGNGVMQSVSEGLQTRGRL